MNEAATRRGEHLRAYALIADAMAAELDGVDMPCRQLAAALAQRLRDLDGAADPPADESAS